MEFDGIDPQNKVLMATIDVDLDAALQDPDAPVAQLVAPKDTLTVIVAPTTDGASLVYPAGQPMTLRQVRIPTEPGSGYIRDWPFDRYPTSIVVLASTADGKNSLPVDVSFGGSVQGWHVSAEEADPDAPDAALGRVYDVQMRRSLGVVLFGIAIVLVLIALPFLALVGGDQRLSRPAQVRAGVPVLDRGDAVRHHPDPQLPARLTTGRILGGRRRGHLGDHCVDRRVVLRSRLLVEVRS